VRRISVVGNAGSGKTTAAVVLARQLDAPHIELDAIYHQPGWQALPIEQFRLRVAEKTAGDRWVIDGNYSVVRDLIWARADTVVWVDPPRRTVMRRVLSRTVTRVVRHTELWNGNRERWHNLLSVDPSASIVVWAWSNHQKSRQRYASAMADPALAHLRFVRIASGHDLALLLTELRSRPDCAP
jgi:adenylate kinase family enzyme